MNVSDMNLNPTTYEEAMAMLEAHPYFAYSALKALDLARTAPGGGNAGAKAHLKAILAANICEESSLREILGLNSESLADFYPDEIPPQLSTEDTIDTFLEKFGSKSADVPEGFEVSVVPEDSPYPANPELDYLSNLQDSIQDEGRNPEEEAEDETLSTIDAFLKAVPPPRLRERVAQKEALSEGFAKILIKNGNYSKALEIIQELNLKNPEKSIYFADQIRFLKKLIINESKKQ